jgi:hypothetical protein
MPFIKLEERDGNKVNEYFIRADLIQEVDATRDGSGQIVSLDVYLENGGIGQADGKEEPQFTFQGEEAANAYAVLYPFLTAASPGSMQ